jgi:hypothetical protein
LKEKPMKRVLKWLAIALAGSASILLVGCGNKPPKCGDEEVTSLVIQVFREAVEKEAASMGEERLARFRYTQREAKPTLETITAQSIDEKVGKTTCQATLRVSVPADAITAIAPDAKQYLNAKFETVGSRIESTSIMSNIQYSAQRTENAKELEVTAQGHRFAVDLLHEVALLRFFDKPFPPDAQPAAVVPAQPPTSIPVPAVDKSVAESEVKSTPTVAAEKPSTPAVSSPSVEAKRSPLCQASERTVVACNTGKKQIAVCAVGELGTASGQLTYRVAAIGQAPEMTYPDSPMQASAAFKLGSQNLMGDKQIAFLSFDKGQYRYLVYETSGKGLDKSGVAVEQSGKRIANLACASEQMFDWSAIQRSALSADTRAFDLP